MKPWIIKYRPKTTGDMVGQDEPLAMLKNFIANYKAQKKRAMLIYGPPGTGKTSGAYAIADELKLEIIEINASDFRNKDKVDSIVGQASLQMSLFARGKIILVDEIDGLSGTKDRGGIAALAAIIKKTRHPMVLTAHDPYDRKYSKLRSACSLAGFERLGYLDIFRKLGSICAIEKIKYDETALKSLARMAGGDMRAAINDLQSLSQQKQSLEKADLENLAERMQTASIVDALIKILKTTDTGIALSALDNVNEDHDQLMLWLDENLPKEYTKPEDLNRAYDKLSKADVFRRRIRRWQHWRFLFYINSLLTAGVAVSKDEKYREFVKYGPTRRLLKIWMANQRYMKRKAIAEKIAEKTHTSSRVALRDTLPYLQPAFRKNKGMAEQLTEYLELDDDEIGWLKK